MAEDFKIIETQEQFDSAIKGRLEREKSKYAEQIAELEEKLQKQTDEAQKQISELTQALNTVKEEKTSFDNLMAEKDAKIKEYELHSVKTQIAHELGLSFEAVDFLRGSDESEIRKSAESLKGLVGTKTAPLATETPISSDPAAARDNALRSVLQNLDK